MSFLFMLEGDLFPVVPHPPNSHFRSHVSSLAADRADNTPVSCVFFLVSAGRSIRSRHANLTRLLCHSRTPARQILITGSAGMLKRGPRSFCCLMSARWWRHRACACLWGEGGCGVQMSGHVTYMTIKLGMLLCDYINNYFPSNDAGPHPLEQQGRDLHY